MNPKTKAEIAIRAARNFKSWGRYAAWRYCEKRGVSFSLYRLARVLEAAENIFWEGLDNPVSNR